MGNLIALLIIIVLASALWYTLDKSGKFDNIKDKVNSRLDALAAKRLEDKDKH